MSEKVTDIEPIAVSATSLQVQFGGDWAALEAALPGLIAQAVTPFFRQHQREGVRFATELLRAQHPPCDRAARVLEKFLASDRPMLEDKG